MNIDPKIVEAVQLAVIEAGQDKGLSQKIIAWTEAITSGNEDVEDSQSAQRHLDLLYQTVKTSASSPLSSVRAKSRPYDQNSSTEFMEQEAN